MRRSRILERLRAGKVAQTFNVSLGVSPLAVELAGRCGADGIWLDSEHRPFTQQDLYTLIMACRLADTDAMVRIRKGEGYTSFFRPLEDGAAGILVPHIKTREEAEWVVYNAKYPPVGRRGVENVMPDADLGFADSLAYLEHANRETFVAIQIEDVEALDNLDDIIGTPGVEFLFVGPADLGLSMGIPFDIENPRMQEAIKKVASAAAKAGKYWGLPVGNVAAAQRYYDLGARYFNLGGDYGLLREGFTRLRREFTGVFG
jgi:4-hydroxy-2-oxoheptanedioate aldolase